MWVESWVFSHLHTCIPLPNPHRQKSNLYSRFLRPWDFPGKSTGVGCHCLLQCMKVKSESEVRVVSNSQRPHGLQPTRLLRPWDFPGKSAGAGCHCLLQCMKVKSESEVAQSCPTLCDPRDGSPPGSPSLGFFRREHWSGLPFPSPMHESEKWKWSCSVVSDSSWPHGLQPTRLLRPWDFPGKRTRVGCHSLLWYFTDGMRIKKTNNEHHHQQHCLHHHSKLAPQP